MLFLVAGVGNAAIMVLTIPFLADLVPRHHMGAATGLLAAAGSLAAPLTSLLAGWLAGLYGPRVIFAVMAVGVVAALLLIQQIQVPTADDAAPRPAGDPTPVARGGRRCTATSTRSSGAAPRRCRTPSPSAARRGWPGRR